MKITEEKYLEFFVVMFASYPRKGVHTIKQLIGEVKNDLGIILDNFKVDIIKGEQVETHKEDLLKLRQVMANKIILTSKETENVNTGTEKVKATKKVTKKVEQSTDSVKGAEPNKEAGKEVNKVVRKVGRPPGRTNSSNRNGTEQLPRQ